MAASGCGAWTVLASHAIYLPSPDFPSTAFITIATGAAGWFGSSVTCAHTDQFVTLMAKQLTCYVQN
jgi:hypothetical protein